MPTTPANGIDLNYEQSGSGPATIVFAHGLLMDLHLFDAQRAALSDRYRCIAYDHRGQGGSSPDGPFDMDTLTEDAVDLIRATGSEPCHFVGLSMGGFVGMRLAARYPDLVRSLVLLNTSARGEPFHRQLRFRAMQAFVRLFGPGPLVGQILPLMFGRSFRVDPGNAMLLERWRHHLKSLPRRIVGPVGGVLARAPVLDELAAIRCPTLVVVGDEDQTTPPAEAQRIAAGVRGARLVILPRCGHSSAVEAADQINRLLGEFFAAVDATR
jgi:pimeloyl-ACP methyl ester carboxylesterase